MTIKRKLIITSGVFCVLILLGIAFFLSVRFGAKLHYHQESSFNAFKIMRDLEALRTDKVESDAITALINEKETDLDAKLMTVSTYQKNSLIWLGFLLRHTNDAVFLRSVANYRQRYPSKPMDTTVLNKEQRLKFLRFYADIIKEQKLLLEKYR